MTMTNAKSHLPPISIDAFTVSPEGEGLLERVSKDACARQAIIDQYRGGLAQAIDHYGKSPSPGLILIELSTQDESLFDQLNELALRCEAGTHLVLLGPANDIRFYQRLISLGVSDYIALPADEAEVLNVLGRVLATTNEGSQGRVVSVIAATGGCGASSLARIVAQLVGERQTSASILLDFDLVFGSAGFALGLNVNEAYAQALQTPGRMDQVLLERLLQSAGPHLQLLISPTLAFAQSAGSLELDRILSVARKSAPFVFLDLPHGWTPQLEQAIALSDEYVVVTPPTLLGLRNTKLLLPHLPHDPHLILSQTGMRGREEISSAGFGDALGIPPLASMRFDPRLFTTAESLGRNVLSSSRHRRARSLLPLIDRLSPPSRKLSRYSFPILRLLGRA